MSFRDDEVTAVRRLLDRLESSSEADFSDILDSLSEDPWQQHNDSAPTTPILYTSPSQGESRAIFLSPLVLPALDDALEANQPLPQVQMYDSPRIYKPDNEIFPSLNIECQKWQRPDDRWKAISEQAGKHRQDGTVLKVCKRLRSPSALKVGVMTSAAHRVQELHLQMDRMQQASLRHWMDVISELFKNLKHLHLFDYDQTRDSSFTRRDRRSNKNEGNLSDDECVVDDGNSENVPSRLISNKRLYVLYRLPKLISIDGKIVTVSERLMARPTKLNEKPSQKVSTVKNEQTQTIQKFQPVHISLKGNNNLSIGRTDWFMKPPGGPNVLSSLLDASENEDDEALTDITEQCVEVSLSGCILEQQAKQPVHETTDSDHGKFIILPLLDSKNIDSTEGTLSALAKLDRLEYCTSVGGSVACEWSAACGILALPSFRRTRQQQILKCKTSRSSSSLSTSTDTEKNSNGTPRRNLIFKSPNSSTRKSEKSISTSLHCKEIASNLSRSRGLDSSFHSKSSKPWVLKSNGKLISPKCKVDGGDSKWQRGKNLTLAKDGRSRSHMAKTSSALSQDNEVRCETATSPMTTEIEKPRKTSRLRTSISERTMSHNNNVQSTKADSLPTTPRRSASLKLLAASKSRIASQSLASPFPMQFRVRARPSPKSIDMKHESSELSKKGTLYVQTQFEAEDLMKNQSGHKSQSNNVDKSRDQLSSTKSMPLELLMPDITPSSPTTSKSQNEDSKSSAPVLSKKPPQCPLSSHRRLVMKSSTSSLSAKNKSDHSHRHRIQARSNSILDDDFGDDDDDDSTCEESIPEGDYPALEIEL